MLSLNKMNRDELDSAIDELVGGGGISVGVDVVDLVAIAVVVMVGLGGGYCRGEA